MKIYKKVVLFGLLCLISATANAQFENTEWGKITNLNLTNDGSLTVATTATRINPANCPFSAYLIFQSESFFRNYYALLLSTEGFDNEVRFRISDVECAGPNPKIIFMETRDAE